MTDTPAHAHRLTAVAHVKRGAALGLLLTATALAQTNHVVKEGENLERIARRYGVRVSALIAENNLAAPDKLKPGQTLKIPASRAPRPLRYTVEEGDSLSRIARDFGIDEQAILALNNLTDPDTLRVGQVLEIPPRVTAPPAAPRYALAPDLKARLDATPVRPGRWKYIVVHHSATANGSVQSMDHYHRYKRRMENGLAYHFVIGNGNGMPNGAIAIGQRWRSQIKGGHLASDALNEVAIGICLVGNFERSRPTPEQMRSLYALVGYLMQRTRTSAAAVRTHRQINTKPTECPGRNFPTKALLQNLP